ncbi:glycosyltransferase family 4 protein [Coleofasciculus sp. G2-EDA-02]|uniref:glycosyltransferase family 4 protein n=1 Tax=Coleofasciculus sp. G2-EDA-02 TaxID=3069529 RepID=UPI003303D87E
MRIAQIAPLWERVPPPAYGGTELVVSLLTDELIRRGHEVTLFASGDSETLAKLASGCKKALRSLDVTHQEYAIYEQMQLSKVFERANEFDVIHSHVDYPALPYTNLTKTPVVHTIHGTFSPLVEQIFTKHRQQHFVSISNSQQRPELGLNYVATVYNAIAPERFTFYSQPKQPPYLAFVGRISPEKGPRLAIEIAKRSGWHLKIAGKVDPKDRAFFEAEVEPLIDGKQIEFLGEANHEKKNELMGGAVATLFPITWREPFGLVMIESMASGTPVIAMALGSAPEIIVHGKTGFLCDTVDECVDAIVKIPQLNRQACREHVETNFAVKRMVDGYEAVYNQILAERFAHNGHLHVPTLLAS